MAKLSNVGTVLVAGESVPLRIVIQGYKSTWVGQVNDEAGAGIDLSAATITCTMEFWSATIAVTTSRTAGDTATVSSFSELDSAPADASLSVTKDADQSANPGRFTILIPSDIYTGDIEPNTDNLPVGIGMLKYEKGGEIRVLRFMLAFRRGVTT